MKSLRMVLEDFEIGRQRVIRAGLLGKQERRVQAERRADTHHVRARRTAAAAPRTRGRKASSSGKASETPAPRRNLRRCIAARENMVAFMCSPIRKRGGLLGLENLALDDFVDERAQAAPLGLDARQDRFHHVAIGELDARAGGVSEQILRQVARHLILALAGAVA